MKNLANKLGASKLHKFADFLHNDIPNICAGVYSVYDLSGDFLYIGMAGAELNKTKVEAKEKAKKKSGLQDRLRSHASGYRSGDRFNIYVGDLYVLSTLSAGDIKKVAERAVSFDSHIKSYIRDNLSYRYLITEHSQVRKLEAYIQKNGISGVFPKINGKA